MRVAVTAVGGGIGQSIIKCLHGTEYKTVGIDPKEDAAGLYMADVGCIGKNVSDANYVASLIAICAREGCKFIFPGLDSELLVFAEYAKAFRANGITPIISSPRTVELSDNKGELYLFLKTHKLPYIETAFSISEASKRIPLPWILKPMIGGCRSKNVSFCENIIDATRIFNDSPDKLIIQEYIDGTEYTCGSITFDKKVLGTVIMERTLRNGDTYKAYSKEDSEIDSFLRRLLPLIKPFGPCNIQIRVKDGWPYVLEINARCSGTTGARALVGFNEPLITLNHLLGKSTDYKLKHMAIFRYWNECAVEYDKIEEMKNEGSIYRS